ncbi:MAG TPA: enoyl-CoA hydratase-related protein [Nocardioidaceae bacterium]|nr:enoyl-CoA hydratase-related protein [Nocardioidaceae bacterium]
MTQNQPGSPDDGTEPVLYDVRDGVARVTLNRPEAMNSLDRTTKEALLAAVRRAAADESARVVVLTGSGRAFCVGQDLKEHVANLRSRSLDEVWSTVPEHYAPIAAGIVSMPKPVIAAVNGIAAGAGASIAFACDFRVLAEGAGINLAFTGIALSCDTGVSWTLPRLLGRAKATELLLLPRTVRAEEARELGLATAVAKENEFDAEVDALATHLAAGPTLAYASVRASLDYAGTHTLEETLAFEAQMMARTGGSEDHQRAVAAFVAKEKPTFTGR